MVAYLLVWREGPPGTVRLGGASLCQLAVALVEDRPQAARNTQIDCLYASNPLFRFGFKY